MKRGDLDTDTHRGSEHVNTCLVNVKAEMGDVSPSQGRPKIASKSSELGGRPGTDSASQPQKELTLPTP